LIALGPIRLRPSVFLVDESLHMTILRHVGGVLLRANFNEHTAEYTEASVVSTNVQNKSKIRNIIVPNDTNVIPIE
jgi:hypothetical protein